MFKINLLKSLLILHFLSLLLLGQRAPQDTWYLDKEIILSEMPGFRKPWGVTIDPTGNCFVVDRDSHTLTIWDQNGNFVKRIGGYGTADGKFNHPSDVALSESEIFVVERGNHRIQVLDLNGTFIRKWGSYGSGEGQFYHPEMITLDMNGSNVHEVYVADRYHHKIQVFDSNGTYKRSIGSHGSQNHQLNEATGIAIGPDNLLYISSKNNSKIKVFETNGTFVRSFSTFEQPNTLSFFGEKLAIALGDNHKIRIFDKNGTSLSSFGSHGTDPNEFNKFYHPYGLSYDSFGNLHIADSHNDRILVFDQNNSFIRSYGFYGDPSFAPYGLHITPENTFLLTDAQNHRVFETDENGTFLKMIATSGSANGKVNNPRSVFLAKDNRIYVADTNRHRIQIFERNGTFVSNFGTSGTANGKFNQPYGVIVSEDLEIFVVDRYNHRIQVFDSNGTFLRKFGSYGNLEGQLNQPFDIDFTDQGNIMVADFYNRRIVHFTKSGDFIKHDAYNNHPETISNLRHGLTAVTRDGSIYILDDNGNTVKQWNRSGSTGTHEVLADGTIVWVNYSYDKIEFYRPTYRTVRPPVSKDIPLPEVISVVQPDNTNHLEITYRINDTDSSHVNAKMLGFIDGGNDLSKVIVPRTYIGSISGKLDANVSTNQNHTVTWNVGADWSVGYGELEVAILAKDDRDLLNLHFLTLPATETNSTELKISRSPLTNTDLLNVWYWLLANDDAGITRKNEIIHKTETPLASGFSPENISGIQLWLDANDIDGDDQNDSIAHDTKINNWSDKAGGDHNATQNISSRMPTYKTNSRNGKATLLFESDYDSMATTLNLTKPYTVVAVFNGLDSGSRRAIQGSNNWLIGPYQGKIAHYAGSWVSITKPLVTGDYYIATAVNDGSSSKFFVNGQDMTQNSNYTGNPGVIHIGGRPSDQMNGHIAEVIAYDQSLGRSDINNIGKYLSGKWDVSFSSSVYISTSTTTDIGRAYLFDLMNLREATTDERNRAREGAIPGAVNSFNPTFKVGPNDRPNKVNEYGFDTGTTNGYWVTPK